VVRQSSAKAPSAGSIPAPASLFQPSLALRIPDTKHAAENPLGEKFGVAAESHFVHPSDRYGRSFSESLVRENPHRKGHFNFSLSNFRESKILSYFIKR
jgi:hypothetical protein